MCSIKQADDLEAYYERPHLTLSRVQKEKNENMEDLTGEPEP